MARAFDIKPLDATFGAVVTGMKIASIDDAAWHELYATWLEYALLIFPGQHLSRDEQVAFARRFGPLEFNLAALSNVKTDGTLIVDPDNDIIKVLKGNMGWHCDSTYMPVQAKGAVFTAEVVPNSGGTTGWADMRAAYDALDDDLRAKVERLAAHHSLYYSQSKLGHQPKAGSEYSGYGFHDGPVPLRPLVKVHPETGRKSLVIGRHAHNIPDMGADRVRAVPAGVGGFRLPSAAHLSSQMGARRRGRMGQSMPAPSGHAVGHVRASSDVAQPYRRRPRQRSRSRKLAPDC